MHRNVTLPPRRQLRFRSLPKIRHTGVIPEITCREIVATSPSLEIIRRVGGRSLARSNGPELSIPAIRSTFDIIHGIVYTETMFVQCDGCWPAELLEQGSAYVLYTLGYTFICLAENCISFKGIPYRILFEGHF